MGDAFAGCDKVVFAKVAEHHGVDAFWVDGASPEYGWDALMGQHVVEYAEPLGKAAVAIVIATYCQSDVAVAYAFGKRTIDGFVIDTVVGTPFHPKVVEQPSETRR